jgi:hypothetical protein
MLETMAWDTISQLDMLSVGIAFRGVFVRAVFVSAVNMSFIPVSETWVIAMLFIRVIPILFMRVIAVLFLGLWFVAVVVVPPAVMVPLSGMSIGPFMVPV